MSWWKYFDHESDALSLAVVPDGSNIFFGITDPAIIYLDGASGSPIGRLVISDLVGTILLSPTSSNNAILTSYYDGSIYKLCKWTIEATGTFDCFYDNNSGFSKGFLSVDENRVFSVNHIINGAHMNFFMLDFSNPSASVWK
jgi:hypothetical protein